MTSKQIQIRHYCDLCVEGLCYDEDDIDFECPHCDKGWIYKWVDAEEATIIEEYVELVE